MSRPTRVTTALAVSLLLASAAAAAPIAGGVLYPFTATVDAVPDSLSSSGCCDFPLHVGDTLTGALELSGPIPYQSALLRLDLPGGPPVTIAPSPSDYSRQDGSGGGSPDSLSIFGLLSDGGTTTLRPHAPLWGVFEADGRLSLIDLEGNAWSGINPRTGDLFPDAAPLASLFETRNITLNLFAFSSSLPGNPGGQVELTITAFPEPGAGVLAFAALAVLGLVRSSAAGSRRSGRAAAR